MLKKDLYLLIFKVLTLFALEHHWKQKDENKFMLPLTI